MAFNYTRAYKYKNNGAALGKILSTAYDKYQDKKYPLAYYPSGLKLYQSIVSESSRYGGLSSFYNPVIYELSVGTELTTPCVYQVKAVDLSTYSSLKFYPAAVTPYSDTSSTEPPIGFIGISSTYAMLKSSGFDTLITGITVFDDSYDGTYTTTNPRIQYRDFTKAIGAYMTAPETIRYVGGSPQINPLSSGYQFIFNLNMLCSDYVVRDSNYLPAILSRYSPWILTNVLNEYGNYFVAANASCTPTLDSNGFVNRWTNYTGGFMGFICNRKKLINLLNMIGIPFTFDSNCKYQNKSDFGDYVPGGQPSNPTDDGGDPYGDNSSDDMDLPEVQITPTNVFSRLSCCTISKLNQLSDFLFTATFYDNIKLLTNDPLESICTAMYYPFDVYNHSTCSAAHNLTLANVSTNVTVYDLDVSYNMILSMGEIDVTPYYGSYLDYSPHTEIELYLPYKGYVNLPTNDIMGKHLSVKYMIDFYSGAATILVFADTQLVHVDSAQIGINIPISQSNANSRAIALTGAAVGAVGTIAAGAIGGAGAGAAGVAMAAGQTVAQTAAPTASRLLSAAQNHVDKGGSMGGVGWLYAPQKCALIYNRPILAEPKHYKALNGYSTSYSGLVSAYKGFLQADVISGTTTATDSENAQILRLLQDGIFV